MGWAAAYLSSIQLTSWGSMPTQEDATVEGLLTTEGCDEEVVDAVQNDDLHLDVQEAVEVLLHLSSDSPALTLILQDQGDTATT